MFGGEQHARAGILEPGGDGPAAEAGENRGHYQAQLETAVENGKDLRNHRHGHGDAVAGLKAESGQAVGDTIGVAEQLGESDLAGGSVLRFPDAGQPAGVRSGSGPAIQAIVGDIDAAADEPLGPFGAAGKIEHLAVGMEPLDAHLAHHLMPEALGIFAGEAEERFAVSEIPSAR